MPLILLFPFRHNSLIFLQRNLLTFLLIALFHNRALHDNGRATLIGHTTFGKGKIQSVTELHDGSALFITVAKYLSPALHDIDQVGITPDVQCSTDFLNAPKVDTFKARSSPSSLERDSCILVAEHQLDIQESKGSAS